MALSTTQVNANGVDRSAFGSFSGTYTAGASYTINLGWVPKFFSIRRMTDTPTGYEWQYGMASGDYIATVFSTGAMSIATDDKLIVNDDGTITVLGGAGDIVIDNSSLVWEARG